MGCGNSKSTPVTTNALRIEIEPSKTPIETVLFTKTTPLFKLFNSDSDSAVGKPGVSVRPPSNPVRSPSSSSLALSLRKKRLSPDSKTARRSTASIISVEPRVSADVTHRHVSVSSRVTADSGFGEESRAGISAGSRRNGEDEIMNFIAEHSNSLTNTNRPATPELLIEGTPFLPPTHRTAFPSKLSHLPGSVDTVTTANILEKAPLPPIHTLRDMPVTTRLAIDEKSSQRMQVEESFEIIERPPSCGGLEFDILMDVPTEKKRPLRPIQFSSPDPFGKQKTSVEGTKEGLEDKLAAAALRRNEREREIVSSLAGQREIDELRTKEQQERFQESIENREASLGTRMRTSSINREAAVSAIVRQAHKAQQKVETVRSSRKSSSPSPSADMFGNAS